MPDNKIPPIPTRQHPPKEFSDRVVEAFVQKHPDLFGALRYRLSHELGVTDIMKAFLEFVNEQGFNPAFEPYSIFFELCERASGSES